MTDLWAHTEADEKSTYQTFFQESICTKSYDTYCPLGSDHTGCQYCDANEAVCGKMCSRQILDQSERDLIVAKHNELRRRVAKGDESKVRCHTCICTVYPICS